MLWNFTFFTLINMIVKMISFWDSFADWCQVQELKYKLTRESSELIVVPPYAIVSLLKEAVQSAMRDTYFIMEQFVVTDKRHVGNEG
jgi:hypothetical protein